jgi:hypothetical protein
MDHTHILARDFQVLHDDGTRTTEHAGYKITPTENQLRNMSDVFLTAGGHVIGESVMEHGMKGKSIGSIKDEVAGISDLGVLDAMIAEEESERNRKGALKALVDRIEFVTAENEEKAGE